MKRMNQVIAFCAAVFAVLPSFGGVALTPSRHKGVRVEKNLKYGERPNRPDEGAAAHGMWRTNDEFGLPASAHETAQTYDVYYPADGGRGAPVLLYVHGGAWCMPFDKNSAAEFFADIAAHGWAVYSMNYIMPPDFISDPKAPKRPEATFAAMLRDIDLMVEEIVRDVPKRGFSAKRIAIGGESAGGHLSSLYAYDQDCPEQMELNLGHKAKVGLLFCLIAPIDLTDRRFVETVGLALGGKMPKASEDFYKDFNERFMPECGRDIAKYRKYSPLYLVNRSSVPTIVSYSQGKGLDHDWVIPVGHYTALTNRLASCGVPYEARLHTNTFHAETLKPDCRDGARKWYLDTLAKWGRDLR